MGKSLSITVHPSALGAEYLSVSDAMLQVLDMVGALENIEAGDENERKIIWRLVKAHTNSPPFTVVAEAYPKDPQVSIAIEAERVTKRYGMAIRGLLAGDKPAWLEHDASRLFKKALKRNLNGIGHTDIHIDGEETIIIVPSVAQAGVAALERAEIEVREDLRRTEFGSIEGQVIGLTRYYNSPAIVFMERLSGEKIFCVLADELAQAIGPEHKWSEAWDGRYLRIGGELIYGSDGKLKRVNASYSEEIVWSDIPISALRDVDVLQGRTVHEHIAKFWGEQFGESH